MVAGGGGAGVVGVGVARSVGATAGYLSGSERPRYFQPSMLPAGGCQAVAPTALSAHPLARTESACEYHQTFVSQQSG